MAVIQSTSKSAGAVTSSTLAYTSAVTAGNSKFAFVTAANATATLSASDGVDGSYRTDSNLDATASSVGIFTKAPATGGAATVSFSQGSGSGQLKCVIVERDEKIGVVDSSATVSFTTTASPSVGPSSPATSHATELVAVLTGTNGTESTVTAGSGYTLETASTSRCQVEWGTTGSSGTTQSATINLTAGTVSGAMALVAYAPASGGATVENGAQMLMGVGS